MIKILRKRGKRGVLQFDKDHLKISTANMLNGERLNAFSLKLGKMQSPLSLLLFNIFLLHSSQLNKVKKGNKHHTDQKGRNKTLPIFSDMIEIKIQFRL